MIIWQPGQEINNGRFIIQGKPLGSGGFGTTYKALWLCLLSHRDL